MAFLLNIKLQLHAYLKWKEEVLCHFKIICLQQLMLLEVNLLLAVPHANRTMV